MRNQKGLTLLEIMAAITISTLIISGAIMVFFSIQHSWNDSTQKYSDDSQAKLTLDTISKYVTDTVEVYLTPTLNELRIKTGVGATSTVQYTFKSIIYNPDKHTYTMYDLPNVTDANFKGTLDSNTDYSKPTVLAKNAAGFELFIGNSETKIQSALHCKNGELLNLSLNFNYTQIDVHGIKTQSVKPYEISVKLLKIG